jgi:hypothetical protein
MKSRYVSFAVILTNLLVLLVVFNLALFAWSRVVHHTESVRARSRYKSSNPASARNRPDVLKRLQVAGETLAAMELRNYDYDPITQLRPRPLSGRYLNVAPGGFRRVRDQGPWPPDKSALNIFVFGGSTAFGVMLDDDHTIPSYLQQQIGGGPKRVKVYNFARPGYTSTQELLLYLSLLWDGYLPGVTIFIDGLNECQEVTTPLVGASWPDSFVYSAVEIAKQSDDNIYMLLLAASPMGRLATSIAQRLGLDQHKENSPEVPADIPGFIVNRWLKNKKMIESLSRGYDVNAIFVWQPVPAYKYDLKYYKFKREQIQNAFIPSVYPAIEKMAAEGLLRGNFLNLAELQQDKKENLYIDPWHYNETFSRDIAAQIGLFLRRRGVLN